MSFRERRRPREAHATERGYVAPVLIDRKGDVTGIGYGVFGPPTAYLIDREGRLLARMVGARDWKTPAVKSAASRGARPALEVARRLVAPS